MYLPFFFISKSSEQQKTNRDIYTTPPGNVGLKQKQKLNMERLVGNRKLPKSCYPSLPSLPLPLRFFSNALPLKALHFHQHFQMMQSPAPTDISWSLHIFFFSNFTLFPWHLYNSPNFSPKPPAFSSTILQGSPTLPHYPPHLYTFSISINFPQHLYSFHTYYTY